MSAHAALLLMAILWGINFPIAKAALSELSPLAFNALRFPLAALVVLAAVTFAGGNRWPRREHRGRVIWLGLLGNAAYQQFFIFGLNYTRAGTASLLLAGTPVITAVLSVRLGHETVSTRAWIGVCATVVGIATVVLSSSVDDTGQAHLFGDLLMIGASCAWAWYTVGSRDLIAEYGSIQFTAWTLWVGALVLCAIGLPAVLRTDLGSVSGAAWLGVGYAGALSIGVAYLIWYYGVRRIGSTRTATYSNLVPLVALLAAWVQLGEVPLPGQVAGAAIIILGISLAQRRRGPRTA